MAWIYRHFQCIQIFCTLQWGLLNYVIHLSWFLFYFNVPLLFFIILSFMVKLPFHQLVMQQKCLWQRRLRQRCLWQKYLDQCPEYIKNSYNSTTKNSNNPSKNKAKDWNDISPKMIIQMANRHMKTCSMSLTSEKCKSKP